MKMYKMINHVLSVAQATDMAKYEMVEPSQFVKGLLLNSPDTEEGIYSLIFDSIAQETEGIENILCPGGSPAFNALFAHWALSNGKTLWFSHSMRDFEEQIQADGSVKKVNVFRHVKWIKIGEGKEEVKQMYVSYREGLPFFSFEQMGEVVPNTTPFYTLKEVCIIADDEEIIYRYDSYEGMICGSNEAVKYVNQLVDKMAEGWLDDIEGIKALDANMKGMFGSDKED